MTINYYWILLETEQYSAQLISSTTYSNNSRIFFIHEKNKSEKFEDMKGVIRSRRFKIPKG